MDYRRHFLIPYLDYGLLTYPTFLLVQMEVKMVDPLFHLDQIPSLRVVSFYLSEYPIKFVFSCQIFVNMGYQFCEKPFQLLNHEEEGEFGSNTTAAKCCPLHFLINVCQLVSKIIFTDYRPRNIVLQRVWGSYSGLQRKGLWVHPGFAQGAWFSSF